VKNTNYEAPHYAAFTNLLSLSSLFGPNNPLNNIFSDTLSLCSSLNVRNQISHPYTITGKIIILNILGSRQEIRRFWTEW
jgi:hypothetical protein